MLNKFLVAGRMTADPEIQTKGENRLCKFTIACERPKRKGEEKPETDFFTCIAWNRNADVVVDWFGKEVVTTIAYMIGVRMSALTVSYGECAELIEKLKADKDATTIRYLCKLRTVLMQKFKKTDDLMRFQLKNLHSIEWYDKNNIKQLEKWGFTIIQANYRSEKYMQDFTRLINENIDKCSHLFYDWLNWEYIRDLFFVTKYNKNGVMKEEFNKYMANIEHYPFQMYIHWQPAEVGSIVYSDRKFLKIIYGQHNDSFTDYTKYRDADDETRNNIYNFIDSAEKTAIAVDCENSNPYKLYSVLKGLRQHRIYRDEEKAHPSLKLKAQRYV